jgi:hypothetical protein
MCASCLHPQEQRIRASHGIKKLSQQIKEQRLKVADRITKRIGIKPGSSSASTRKAAAAAAAADAQDGSSSGGEGGSGSRGNGDSREYADNVKRGDLLAELIRRNGEELATSVEGVVERVSACLMLQLRRGVEHSAQQAAATATAKRAGTSQQGCSNQLLHCACF